MTAPFIFINTYTIKEGQLEAFKKAFGEVLDLVESSQPRVLYFGSYFNEEDTEATVLQIHPDAESMENHMRLAAENIRESADIIDFSTMRIQLLGQTNDSVLENMRQLAGSGVPVAIKEPAQVVDRLASTDSAVPTP